MKVEMTLAMHEARRLSRLIIICSVATMLFLVATFIVAAKPGMVLDHLNVVCLPGGAAVAAAGFTMHFFLSFIMILHHKSLD